MLRKWIEKEFEELSGHLFGRHLEWAIVWKNFWSPPQTGTKRHYYLTPFEIWNFGEGVYVCISCICSVQCIEREFVYRKHAELLPRAVETQRETTRKDVGGSMIVFSTH